MEDWVYKAMSRWPDVPALYGWLSLDRRGHWRIKGEVISRPQIIDTINRNYAVDARGCWYFQNGPQRGYMQLEYAPFVLYVHKDHLRTHTGQTLSDLLMAFLDEEGSLLLLSEYGAGLLLDQDLPWALARLYAGEAPADEAQLLAALQLPSGAGTGLELHYAQQRVPVQRLDRDAMPETLSFVREPRA